MRGADSHYTFELIGFFASELQLKRSGVAHWNASIMTASGCVGLYGEGRKSMLAEKE